MIYHFIKAVMQVLTYCLKSMFANFACFCCSRRVYSGRSELCFFLLQIIPSPNIIYTFHLREFSAIADVNLSVKFFFSYKAQRVDYLSQRFGYPFPIIALVFGTYVIITEASHVLRAQFRNQAPPTGL